MTAVRSLRLRAVAPWEVSVSSKAPLTNNGGRSLAIEMGSLHSCRGSLTAAGVAKPGCKFEQVVVLLLGSCTGDIQWYSFT